MQKEWFAGQGKKLEDEASSFTICMRCDDFWNLSRLRLFPPALNWQCLAVPHLSSPSWLTLSSYSLLQVVIIWSSQ